MFRLAIKLLSIPWAIGLCYKHGLDKAIINGSRASSGQFPWQVALAINTLGGNSLCGGCIISPDWVLTAAHCLEEGLSLTVVYGTLRVLDNSDPLAQYMSSRNFIQHEEHQGIRNDLGLVKVDVTLLFNDLVQAIPITNSDLLPGEPVTASGWGLTSDNGVPSNELLYIDLVAISKRDCERSYSMTLGDDVVCANSISSAYKSICGGDSGGALVANATRIPELKAIASFSDARGCSQGYPQGFANIYYFRDWISLKGVSYDTISN